MSIEAGTSVGPYDVLAPIGAGGMGEVYRARDRRLGREVALKVLPANKLVDEDRKQRFIQEAKTASSLNHPNIVTIYDIGSQDGIEYIAMEYVKGRTLDEITPEKGLRLNETLRLSIAIADALSRAHAAGIVHRDLKPGNIMVTDDGAVKLLDFGLAKLIDPALSDTDHTMSIGPGAMQTIEGTILGTVSYMSPEQAKGMPVDARSDIFSFGALVYEMVTGRRAFKCESPIATLSAILTADPQRISSVAADIPAELERVISRCMRKEPEKRWQNMKDVKVALEELKEESDSGTLIASRINLPPVKRQRNWVGITTGICLFMLCSGAVAWMLLREALRSRQPAAAVVQAPAQHVSAAPDQTLTNDSIIQLVGAHVSVPVITSHIRSSKTNFDLSTPELIRLAKAGVPDAVIEVMRNPKASSQADPRRSAMQAPTIPPPAAPEAPVPSQPEQREAPTVEVPDGTKVMLVVSTENFAAEAAPGDVVRFVVRDNVIAGDHLVIAKGATATGTVTETERKRLFGKGKLMMKFGSVTSVDGQHLRIRPSPIADSLDRPIPLTKSTAELVVGLPVFLVGPATVKGAQLQ